MEINKLSDIKKRRETPYILSAVCGISSVIIYFMDKQNNLSVLFMILAAIFLIDVRYWDMKYHLIKNSRKSK